MATSSVTASPGDDDPKLAVGYQKLTTDEFFEALASAVLEKVRSFKQEEIERKPGL